MKIFLKKLVYLSFLFLIHIFLLQNICFADDMIEEVENDAFLETTTETTNQPNILSKNVIVIDRKTQSVLYEKEAYKQVPMASTTKIMTCIVALEKTNLKDTVLISQKAASIHGSTLGIIKNTKMSMQDLLYGLMLRSGNDCAIAIAEHISGSVEEFAKLMNQKAAELGLKNTNFVTPHGLDDDNHYTTAYELAILTNYALKNEIFQKIVSCKTTAVTINHYSKTISNTNELLGNLEGVYGVKTGFTFNAGRCLVSSCKRNNLDIIVVVLGADTKKTRTKDSRNLIEYIFQKFEYTNTYPIVEKNFQQYISEFKKNIILEKTTDLPTLKLSTIQDYEFPLRQEDIFNLSTKIYMIHKFSPQIQENEKIGVLTVYSNDKILYSLDIIMTNCLHQNSVKYYYIDILKKWVSYFHS